MWLEQIAKYYKQWEGDKAYTQNYVKFGFHQKYTQILQNRTIEIRFVRTDMEKIPLAISNQKVDCRAGHSHGFYKYKGKSIYEDDSLKNDILVVSNQTGFAMDYMVEIVVRVDISSATFEGLAKEYNIFDHMNMKLPYDVMDRRVQINEDVVNNAFFPIHLS